MVDVVPFSELKKYPNAYIGGGYLKATREDGLITPIVAYRNGEIHPRYIERYEAFRRQAEAIGRVNTAIVVWFEELDDFEKLDL